MKKLSGSNRPEFIIPILLLVSALGTGFLPPPAAAMDVQLVLATEEVVKEMQENGELREHPPAVTPPFSDAIPPAGAVPPDVEGTPDPVAPGSEPEEPVQDSEPSPPAEGEDLTVESGVVPEPGPGELVVETEVLPAPGPGELVVETEVVPETGPGELVIETEVVPEPGPGEGIPESGSDRTGDTPPAPSSLKESLDRRVTLKYVDTDIRVVLRSLARAYDFNVTLAPEVQGNVTVDFSNVRIGDVLEAILVDRGFGYQVSGEIIRVTTREKIQQETTAAAAQEAAAAQKAASEVQKKKDEEVVEPLVVEIFDLKYIDADDARAAIEPLLTVGRGKATVLKTRQYRGFEFEATETFAAEGETKEVSEFVRSRVLIVQDIRAVLDRVGEVIKSIDRRPPQILIDAKIIEVPVDQESRLGINWTNALNQWEIGASDLEAILGRSYYQQQSTTDSSTRERGNEFEWLGTEESGRDVRMYDGVELQDGDTRGDMRYSGSGYPASGGSDISIPNLFDFTIPGNAAGGPFQQNAAWRAAVENNVRTAGWAGEYYSSIKDTETRRIFDDYLNRVSDTLAKMTTSGQTYSAVLGATDFSLMLSAMKTDSNVVVLSNPRIIVHENYAAKIFVGERYPILSTEVSGEGGGAVGGTSVDEWREIGITLKVIPQVRNLPSGGKGINMIIHPAVSKRTGAFAEYRSVTGQLAYSSYPIIDIREADTNVTINDGDTIVIGGLISSYTQDEESKIPLLGDIPLLGYLFKEEHTKLQKVNLLIFITARMVTEETQFSTYEKMMLEKAPPEALGDVRYFEDERVRPYLYRPPAETAPAEEESSPPEENQPAEDSEAEEGNRGNFQGRVITKAMKRSRR